jgi:hypothetical protein
LQLSVKLGKLVQIFIEVKIKSLITFSANEAKFKYKNLISGHIYVKYIIKGRVSKKCTTSREIVPLKQVNTLKGIDF